MEKKENFKDEYYLHEAMHMASVMADMIDKYVSGHPSVSTDKKWKAKADKAGILMAELYADIAAERFKAINP